MAKRICLGILAHVDAGKTTLSEALLYKAGAIRKQGRVDSRDSFLDNDSMERARGITIFSKQAVFTVSDSIFTLMDTPGHVDFSAETERTLQILDYAVLVVSAPEGVQPHTKTLWEHLKRHNIPVFIFVNKTDMPGTDKTVILSKLHDVLSENIIDFSVIDCEETALCDEKLLEGYLETGRIERNELSAAIKKRKIFPCFFGSALKLDGIDEFLEALYQFTLMPDYGKEFGARIFKISRDPQGSRLSFLKVTGGCLTLKMPLINDEKVNQIRIYSGEKFTAVNEAESGTVCAVTGILSSKSGQSLGSDDTKNLSVSEPVLSYRLILADGADPHLLFPKLKRLEEEETGFYSEFNESAQEITVHAMGPVQIEILKNMISERLGSSVDFGGCTVVYKETVANTVEGVGHFEPLKHYAEVHLLIEPSERGSGIELASECSEDVLEKNWQRLIMTHLAEKQHRGVLTNSVLTDVKITLAAGRAHKKHTEGGDFRQAVYRAVRQGLMQAESVLLEPYYSYTLSLPHSCVGRAMTDFERMNGSCRIEEIGENAVLSGEVPVRTLGNYHIEIASYTKGEGRLSCQPCGYYPCRDSEKIIKEINYEPEADVDNTADSVFCAHGSGFIVPWYDVKKHMHIESVLKPLRATRSLGHFFNGNAFEQNDCGAGTDNSGISGGKTYEGSDGCLNDGEIGASCCEEEYIGTDEIDEIINRTARSNSRDGEGKWKHKKGHKVIDSSYNDLSGFGKSFKPEKKDGTVPYLLVDGYNVIFAWQELNELANVNLDSARGALLDRLCNYSALKQCEVIAVFDAYRVKGHDTEFSDYNNIHVVFTREAETADQYIEKFAHDNSRKYNIRVATSDGLEQIIILGQGCTLVSAREFEQEVKQLEQEFRENYINKSY